MTLALVLVQIAFLVESATAPGHRAKETSLIGRAKQSAMLRALMVIEIAFVVEGSAAVLILTDEACQHGTIAKGLSIKLDEI